MPLSMILRRLAISSKRRNKPKKVPNDQKFQLRSEKRGKLKSEEEMRNCRDV